MIVRVLICLVALSQLSTMADARSRSWSSDGYYERQTESKGSYGPKLVTA